MARAWHLWGNHLGGVTGGTRDFSAVSLVTPRNEPAFEEGPSVYRPSTFT